MILGNLSNRPNFVLSVTGKKPEMSCGLTVGKLADGATYGWSERKPSALPPYLHWLYVLLVGNGSRCVFVAVPVPIVPVYFLAGGSQEAACAFSEADGPPAFSQGMSTWLSMRTLAH